MKDGWSRRVLSGKRGDTGRAAGHRARRERTTAPGSIRGSLWVQERTHRFAQGSCRSPLFQRLAGERDAASEDRRKRRCARSALGRAFRSSWWRREPLVQRPDRLRLGAGRQALGRRDGRLSAGPGRQGQARRARQVSRRHRRRWPLRQGHRLSRRPGFPDRRAALAQGRARDLRSGHLLRRGHRRDRQGRTCACPLYTGFREGNQQHRVNGLIWGLDNWIYCANGDSGGRIKSVKTGASIDLSGRDFRIRPDDGGARRPGGADAVWPQPRRLGQLVRLQQQQSDVALRPRRPLHPPQSAPRRSGFARAGVGDAGRRRRSFPSAARCRASTIRTRPTISRRRAAPSSTAMNCSARRSPTAPSSASRSTTWFTAKS